MNRKLSALLLTCLMLLALTGCGGKNKVIRAIDAIGTVTMDSLEKIEKAEALYARLEEAEQAEITNKEELDAARAEYQRQSALIQAAADAIDAIGTVTIERTPAIADAREAYDAASVYDTGALLAEKAEVLQLAEDALRQLISDAEPLLEKIGQLKAEGANLAIEELAAPYALYLPEGELRTQLSDAVMEALCAEAKLQLEAGSNVAAMELMERTGRYGSGCSEEALARRDAQLTAFREALSRNTPSNGTILERTYNAGRNIFTVTVGSTDTCVKLELVSDPEKYVMFFVRANETVKVNLLNGTYRIKYTTGEQWYGEAEMFGPNATCLMLDETVEVAGYTTTTHVYWHTVSCTLHSGYDAELGAQNMDPADF